MFEFPLLPESASTIAGSVDTFFYTLVGLSLFFSLGISAVVLFFMFRYRRGSGANRRIVQNERRDRNIELTWTIIPLFLALGMFGWSANIYFDMIRPPADAMEIQVVGKQWMWQIQHANGQREINSLHVPVDTPVKLKMISQDVIHSFFIPAFRIKQDVLPGRYTTEWFEATEVGEYRLFCAEYCGTEHSSMMGSVIVMTQADFDAWLGVDETGAGGSVISPEAAGAALFNSFGCVGCHVPAKAGVGPAIGGIVGETVNLEGGESVVVDDNYLRESILLPNAKVVAGFNPVMPTFEGQVSEDELFQLIAYIKSLSESQDSSAVSSSGGEPSAVNGEALFNSLGCTACHQLDAVVVGPALGGIFGHEVTLEDGTSITADEAYIRESILMPNEKVVEGFPAIMTPFEGVVSDSDLADLVEYLKSLSE